MRWRVADPVQEVAALLAQGDAAVRRLAADMRRKPAMLRSLETAHGEGWAVVFAGRAEAEEPLLPWIAGATPLYALAPGWWLPVGVTLDIPDHQRDRWLSALAADYGFSPPAVIAAKPGVDDVDVYRVGTTAPFSQTALA